MGTEPLNYPGIELYRTTSSIFLKPSCCLFLQAQSDDEGLKEDASPAAEEKRDQVEDKVEEVRDSRTGVGDNGQKI